MGGPRSSRHRAGLSILAALLLSTSLVSWQSSALGQETPTTDRWSGRWDVEGQSQENGPFSRFGILTLEMVTDGSVTHSACDDSDRYYRGTYPYGGGGRFEGCESARLDYELFFKYYNDNGSWGQGVMTFKGGSPAKWEGFYSPPTTGTTGVPADLRWRGTKIESCPAPESNSRSRSTLPAQTEQPTCDTETVSFTFTQGGLPPRHSRALEDVRTVGTGKITFIPNEDDLASDHRVTQHSGRVVRELEYVHDEDRLRFKISPMDGEFIFIRDRGVMRVGLKIVESTDSRCSEKTRNGEARGARISIRDGSDSGDQDIVSLVVDGCDHHNYEFKGNKRVKVAIVRTVPS